MTDSDLDRVAEVEHLAAAGVALVLGNHREGS